MPATTTYTPEQRKEWYSTMRKLAADIRSMTEEQREAILAKIGTTITAEGHPLSPFNTIYLHMQSERVHVQVGGVRQWRKVGRAVRKGETACGRIWVPLGKRDDADSDANGDGNMKFRLVPVFDVDQTIEVEG